MKRNSFDENRLKENPEIEPYFYDISAELAARSYFGTSQYPERAGSLDRASYALSLIEDKAAVLCRLNAAIARSAEIASDSDSILENWFDGHRERVKSLYLGYFTSHSHCISSFITGPANFPVARAQKYSQRADKRRNDILEFRNKSIRYAIRSLLPHGDGKAINTDDPKAPKKIASKIEAMEGMRELMKSSNKAYAMAQKMGLREMPWTDIPKEKIEAIQAKTGLEGDTLKSAITFVPKYGYIRRPFT